MNETVVADRYARALVELGAESGQLNGFTDQLRRFAQTYAQSPDLQNVFKDPAVDEARRMALVDALARRLGLVPALVNAVKVLIARRRIGVVGQIAQRMGELADERAGIARASISSAVPLTATDAAKLQVELERLTGKKIVIERREDPSLIAGLVARVGDHVIDASLKGQLAELERLLTGGTSAG